MADVLPAEDAGCFLCGRPGAVRVPRPEPEFSASGAPVLRYRCPTCGDYQIHSIVSDRLPPAQPHEFVATAGPDKGSRPVEMESAALEHWSKALEEAERHRRSRNTEPQPRHVDPSASAEVA